jgi:hypothetical protein
MGADAEFLDSPRIRFTNSGNDGLYKTGSVNAEPVFMNFNGSKIKRLLLL